MWNTASMPTICKLKGSFQKAGSTMIDAKAWHKRDALVLAVSSASKQRRNRLLVRRHGYPHFGDDTANVTRRGDVKRRVSHLNIGRGNALGTDQPHFIPMALFDGNIRACWGGAVNSRERCSHIKRNMVLFGQHRQAVGTDLVGSIAIGSDAVSAYDDQVNLPGMHEIAGHVVRDQRHGDAVTL